MACNLEVAPNWRVGNSADIEDERTNFDYVEACLARFGFALCSKSL
jgi:hypothetical protein